MGFLSAFKETITKGPGGRLFRGLGSTSKSKDGVHAIKNFSSAIVDTINPINLLGDVERVGNTGVQLATDVMKVESDSGVLSNGMLLGSGLQPELAPVLLPGAFAVKTTTGIVNSENPVAGALQSAVELQTNGTFDSNPFKNMNDGQIRKRLVNQMNGTGDTYLPSAQHHLASMATSMLVDGKSATEVFNEKKSFLVGHLQQTVEEKARNLRDHAQKKLFGEDQKHWKTINNSFPAHFNGDISHISFTTPKAVIEDLKRHDLHHNPTLLDHNHTPLGEFGFNTRHIHNNLLDAGQLPESVANAIRGTGSRPKRRRNESAPGTEVHGRKRRIARRGTPLASSTDT